MVIMVVWSMDILITKEQFLLEHNKLSPENLQATFALLTQFQEEKRPQLKDADWSFKLRLPFILWMNALPPRKEKYVRKPEKSEYRIYPENI